MKRVAQCSKKKASPFIPEHEVKYGLMVSSRSAADGAVTAVVCRFCIVFGPFRAENYQTHLNDQHPNKWL
jgi:hypothetical protein